MIVGTGMARDDRLARWRADTPGAPERVHLNNAGAALSPRPVLDAVARHLALEARLGGYEAADAVREDIGRAYVALAALLGTADRNVAVVENATVAFAQALSAFDLRPGDPARDHPGRLPLEPAHVSVARAAAGRRGGRRRGSARGRGGRRERARARPPSADPARRAHLGADQLGAGAGRARGRRGMRGARRAVHRRRVPERGADPGGRRTAPVRLPGGHRSQVPARTARDRVPLRLRRGARARRRPAIRRHARRRAGRRGRAPAARRRAAVRELGVLVRPRARARRGRALRARSGGAGVRPRTCVRH